MESPRILTDRLLIDPVRMDDAPCMFSYRSQPEIHRWHTQEPKQLADMEAFIEQVLAVAWDTKDTWYQLAIRSRATEDFIGDFGVHFVDEGAGQVEIGYSVATEWQGKGLATEAVRGVLNYVFAVMGKHRVFASVDPRNGPSIRVLARLAFRKEAHHLQSMWFKEAWVDDLIFAMLRSEWLEREGDAQA